MNVTATGVTNAANLALFMVNVTHVLLRELRHTDPDYIILDLKAHYRGRKYVEETTNCFRKCQSRLWWRQHPIPQEFAHRPHAVGDTGGNRGRL